jgi:protein translocase SEC61 complex gamma subunit
MARKPTNDEFSKTSKITGAGILLIGGLGFLIFLLAKIVAPWIVEFFGLA